MLKSLILIQNIAPGLLTTTSDAGTYNRVLPLPWKPSIIIMQKKKLLA